MADFYETLGVTRDATHDEIKRAFRKLAVRWHPDKNTGNEAEAEEIFKRIAQAWDTLGDESKRRDYDEYMRNGGEGCGGDSSYTDDQPPCAYCGGTCPPGDCPFAGRVGRNPFASRGDPRVRRTNRRTGEDQRWTNGHDWIRQSSNEQGYHRARFHSAFPAFGLEQAEAVFRAFFQDSGFNFDNSGFGDERPLQGSSAITRPGGGDIKIGRMRGGSLFNDDPRSGGDAFFSADWFHTSSFSR